MIQIGDKVFVYKMGEGFLSGEELEFGAGIITDIREYKSINHYINLSRLLHLGSTARTSFPQTNSYI